MAYYLKSNGFTPMLCACDTFRSGAVEQLRVHAQSLEVPLYEKGYGRDASGIATDGISHAKQMGYDVVMVDTAGRMQDNEPLMRALAKLVNVNSPDLVLFVGEALAGNDAVDQVTGFNQALGEYSVARAGRLIDGIMLTKFDTINDKVGAALLARRGSRSSSSASARRHRHPQPQRRPHRPRPPALSRIGSS